MTSTVPISPSVDTERFTLRCLTGDDVTERYVAWLNDPNVTRYLQTRYSDQTFDNVRAYVESHNNIDRFLFGIFDREQNLHIGNFSLRVDTIHKIGNQGVMIGDKNYWGKGVILEARGGLLDICFNETMRLYKVNGAALAPNLPAVYNYRRQGWTIEGIRRGQFICDGVRVDCIQYAMQHDAWLERKVD